MSVLSIYAGPVARKALLESGFTPDIFQAMYGASGGPKWFILYALDRYIFGEFFSGREKPLHTIGSSAGAWRLGCLAAADPVAAISRLAHRYSHEKYSQRPDLREITESAEQMVRHVFTDQDIAAVVENSVFKTHILVERGRGLASSRAAALQALHLGMSAVANTVTRNSLSLFYSRCVFSQDPNSSVWYGLNDVATEDYQLSEENFLQVMMATGSIPFVLEGVRDISQAAPGVYWDGGIIDYHLDIPYSGEGLVLYPHFSANLIPGWFDKKLPWRRVHEQNYDNVVLLCPSPELVAALPHGKISDRADFRAFPYEERVVYWQKVLDQSQYLADDFSRMVENGTGLDKIRPLSERPGR